eukprot:jgi/Botrbrau1/7340/Bobra.247_3s0035.3
MQINAIKLPLMADGKPPESPYGAEQHTCTSTSRVFNATQSNSLDPLARSSVSTRAGMGYRLEWSRRATVWLKRKIKRANPNEEVPCSKWRSLMTRKGMVKTNPNIKVTKRMEQSILDWLKSNEAEREKHLTSTCAAEEIVDKAHPAKFGEAKFGTCVRGLFSKRKLPQDAFLGEYVGKVIRIDDSNASAKKTGDVGYVQKDKLFDLPAVDFEGDPELTVDAGDGGNQLAFINDARGFPANKKNTWAVSFVPLPFS